MNDFTRTLRDSKTARWGALAVVSFTMLCAYYINYVISPLKPFLEEYLNWSSSDFGIGFGIFGVGVEMAGITVSKINCKMV
jgi:hypothetical protein